MGRDPILQSTEIISPSASSSPEPQQELRAVPKGRWEKTKFVLKMIEIRLRFIAILVGIGALIFYWDTLENYWDRWTRPDNVASGAAGSSTEFYCPMHPSVVRPDPSSCPICGMPLSERKKGEAAELPRGITGRVQLSPQRVQLAGIKTVPAEYRPLAKEIRTVGYVEYDESRLSNIVTRVSGYLERLYVDKTFITVEEGEPLAEIYSPELYSTVQELLLAQQRGSKELIASARKRLRLAGISDQEIDDLLAAGDATNRLVIRSPQSGHVIEKNVVVGTSVEVGETLFKIADLSVVWIEADVYEKDLALLHEGQEIEATVEAYPGKVFPGQVALVHPHLQAETRTNRIRIVVENPEHALRPGMFATVNVKIPLSEVEPFETRLASLSEETRAENTVLAVPESAVIDTGAKKIVYIEREPALFEGVEVKLGPRAEGFYPVISGLDPGDRVAAAGAFLIDAETRLNPGAASAYFGASGGPPGGRMSSAPSTSGMKGGSDDELGQSKEPSADDLKTIAKLPLEDQKLAIEQGVCPITEEPLGSMGVPIKVELKGQPVFLCCQGCLKEAKANPNEILEKVKRLKEQRQKGNSRPVAEQFNVKGKVVALDREKQTVTLDHQDIPGLMKAMTMRFRVKDPEVIAGIKEGDDVQGELTVEEGDYIIRQLSEVEKE